MARLEGYIYYNMYDIAEVMIPGCIGLIYGIDGEDYNAPFLDWLYDFCTYGEGCTDVTVLAWVSDVRILDNWIYSEESGEMDDPNMVDHFCYLNRLAEVLDEEFGQGDGEDRYYDINVSCY